MKNTIIIALATIFLFVACAGNNKTEKKSEVLFVEAQKLLSEGKTEEGIALLTSAAEQGDATAQYNLGLCYYYGEDVKQSYDEAIKWLEKAAEQGYVEKIAEIAREIINDYHNSDEQKMEVASKLCRIVAKKGDTAIIIDLAEDLFFWEDRFYGLEDYIENIVEISSKELFCIAAERGHKGSQFVMGYFFSEGTECFKWYSKAAEQGHREAMYMLGNKYFYGEGVEQNYEEALK